MANTTGAHDPEEQQNDLVAAIKAARELGPDMDHAVAASYLEKQKAAAQALAEAQKPQQPAAVPTQGRQPSWPMFVTPAFGIVLYVALLVVSHGWLWWTFWLIPAFGSCGWWGGRHEAYEARMQRRMARYEWRRARYGYRYGPYSYDDGSGQAPSQPPQVQPPQPQPQPQPQPPSSQQPSQPIEYD